MENGLINTYHYDQYGYYEGVVTTQVLDGAALMPPCCIATAPEVKEGFKTQDLKPVGETLKYKLSPQFTLYLFDLAFNFLISFSVIFRRPLWKMD